LISLVKNAALFEQERIKMSMAF